MTDDQRKLASHMLRELESPSKQLTNWEQNFIESVTEQFHDRDSLTDKQLQIIERIYAEKTA